MKEIAVMDVSDLSPYSTETRNPLWWGFLLMVLIETTVFATLITSYLYLRFQAVEWPPGGASPPGLLLPTANTVLLIASSFVVRWADTGITRGDQQRLAVGMTVGAAMAVIFLALKVVEYSGVPYRWDSHAYGSIVWAIIVLHSAHVLVLVLKTIVVSVLAWRGYFNKERKTGVTVNGLYWHFVVIIWIPLYALLYWSPRIS